FLVVEIAFVNHHPWTLSIGGAAAMLANAWFARRELWGQPREVAQARTVWSSAFYTLLGLGVLVSGIVMQHDDNWIAPGLAIAALVLTLAVYVVPIFEMPVLAQGLLILAQLVAYFPFGEKVLTPAWNMNTVAAITMLLVTWWPRQKVVRTGMWLASLTL